MTTPTQPTETPKPKQPSKPSIQGEPMPLKDLLAFADVDASDAESAANWWDEYASAEWVGALDSEPVKGNKKP
jgi:hypothetical protein